MMLTGFSLWNANAQEFLVKNEIFTVTKEENFEHDGNSLWTWTDKMNFPADWTTPTNFYDGQFMIRYRIISQPQKPGAPGTYRKTKLQFAFWQEQGGSETAGEHVLMNGPGSIETSSASISSWWNKENKPKVDFTRVDEFLKYGIVVWDGESGCMPSTWENGQPTDCFPVLGSNYQDYFFPLQIELTVVAVAEGATFSGWDNYLIPGARPFTTNFQTEKTNEPVPATYEYKVGDHTWPGTVGTGTTIDLTPGTTVYFHKLTDPAGTYYTLVVPSRPSAPTVGLDYANETTDIALSSVYKYAGNPGMTGYVMGDGTKPQVTPGQDAYFQFVATPASFISSVQHLDIPTRPATPDFSFSYLTGKTVENVPNTIEYATNASMTGALFGDFEPVNVVPGTDMYFRVRSTWTGFASEKFVLNIPAQPNEPNVSIDFANKRTSVVIASTMEYAGDVNFTSPTTGAGAYLTLTPGTDVYIRTKSTASSFASKAKFLDVPPLPATPAYGVDFANVSTTTVVPATDEYSTVNDMTGAISGNGNKVTLTPGTDLYFRTKITGTSFASAIQHLVVPAQPAAPLYAVDFANEKTNNPVVATDEYSVNANMSAATSGDGTAVTLTPGTNLYIRKKATGTAFPSLTQTLTVDPRPATPSFAIDYVTEKTTTAVSNEFEYASQVNMAAAVTGNNTALNVTPGANLYFRKKASSSAFASAVQSLIVGARPAKPSYAIDFLQETTSAPVSSDDEYATDASMAGAVQGGNVALAVTPGETYYFRKKAVPGSSFCSDNLVVAAPARPATPSYTIDFANVTTVENVPADVQYDVSNTFSNPALGTGTKVSLTPGTNLHFRVKPTASSFKSLPFSLTVAARPAAPNYGIDYIAEKTSANVPATVEYGESANFAGSTNGTGTQISLTPGKILYFRVKGTASSFPSNTFSLTIPARAAEPAFTINYTNETTAQAVDNSHEYSTLAALTSPSVGAGAVLALTPGTDIYLRKKATSSSFSGLTQHLVVPQRPVITSAEADTTVLSMFNLTITCPPNSTGLEASEVSLTNALLKGFAGDGTYTVQIAPTNNGNVTVNIGANVLTGSNFKANEFKIYFKKSTGFKDIAKLKGVTIYPNPSSGYATISTSNLTGDVLYEISTLQGKAMVSGKLDSGIETLDLNNLPKGIYLVRVSNNGLVSIDKLVIE